MLVTLTLTAHTQIFEKFDVG